jgi:hypothetical protein
LPWIFWVKSCSVFILEIRRRCNNGRTGIHRQSFRAAPKPTAPIFFALDAKGNDSVRIQPLLVLRARLFVQVKEFYASVTFFNSEYFFLISF